MCQNCNLSMRQFLNFVIPGPTPQPRRFLAHAAGLRRHQTQQKRIKTSKFQSCRVTAGNKKCQMVPLWSGVTNLNWGGKGEQKRKSARKTKLISMWSASAWTSYLRRTLDRIPASRLWVSAAGKCPRTQQHMVQLKMYLV
jgi:hypothetical protein